MTGVVTFKPTYYTPFYLFTHLAFSLAAFPYRRHCCHCPSSPIQHTCARACYTQDNKCRDICTALPMTAWFDARAFACRHILVTTMRHELSLVWFLIHTHNSYCYTLHTPTTLLPHAACISWAGMVEVSHENALCSKISCLYLSMCGIIPSGHKSFDRHKQTQTDRTTTTIIFPQ